MVQTSLLACMSCGAEIFKRWTHSNMLCLVYIRTIPLILGLLLSTCWVNFKYNIPSPIYNFYLQLKGLVESSRIYMYIRHSPFIFWSLNYLCPLYGQHTSFIKYQFFLRRLLKSKLLFTLLQIESMKCKAICALSRSF